MTCRRYLSVCLGSTIAESGELWRDVDLPGAARIVDDMALIKLFIL